MVCLPFGLAFRDLVGVGFTGREVRLDAAARSRTSQCSIVFVISMNCNGLRTLQTDEPSKERNQARQRRDRRRLDSPWYAAMGSSMSSPRQLYF
nr:hypothetical protein CFP56_69865 [Quercus suber]